jgi:hypothetical protein
MKTIAVICNNRREWLYFVDTLQFSLTKENKPYKAVAEYIVDVKGQVKYFRVNNHKSGIVNMLGITVNDYLTLASIVDDDVFEYLMNNLKGE